MDIIAILTKSFEALTLSLTSAINHLTIAAIKLYEKLFNIPQETWLNSALDRWFGNKYGQYQDEGRRWTCYIYKEEKHILF